MPLVKCFHNSGEWNQPVKMLEANIARMRSGGRTFGTRTECTTVAANRALVGPGHWAVFHPRITLDGADLGFADCAVEWDTREWTAVEKYTLQLTDFRATTRTGFHLQPSTGIFVHLKHEETKRDVLVGAGHLSLENTADREASWLTETATLNQHFRSILAAHPGWEIVYQCDSNRNQRQAAKRALVRKHLIDGVKGLHNCWEGHIPARGGTHGDRSILDLTLSTMPGGSRLLADDKSSDHRPYETWLTL